MNMNGHSNSAEAVKEVQKHEEALDTKDRIQDETQVKVQDIDSSYCTTDTHHKDNNSNDNKIFVKIKLKANDTSNNVVDLATIDIKQEICELTESCSDDFKIKQEEVEVKDENEYEEEVVLKEPKNTSSNQKEKFKCTFCDYKTSHKSHFASHVITHTGEKPFSCEFCDYKCTKKRYLTIHKSKEHDVTYTNDTRVKLFNCNYCPFKSDRKGLTRHLRTHTGEKPYNCTLCDYRGAQQANLTHHMRTHTGEKPFNCTLCDYKCAVKSYLTIHMRSHTGEKPFGCHLCEYTCAQKTHLKLHISQKHKNDPSSKKTESDQYEKRLCSFCGFETFRMDTLTIHLRRHTGETPFNCSYCAFKCIRKSNLTEHLKIHSGEKPYTCKFCGYQCRNKGILNIHLRIHTGEKPYKCDLCDYKSKEKGSLATHLKSHARKEIVSCSLCEFRTIHKTKLKSHMKIHSAKSKKAKQRRHDETDDNKFC